MRVRGINTSAVISPGDRNVLDLMSVSGGDIVLSADLDLNDNSSLNDAASSGGLSTITDWSSRPSGVRMLPIAADQTASAPINFTSDGVVFTCNGEDSYGGGDYFVNPLGFTISAADYGAVDFSVDIDGFSGQDNLTGGKIWHVFLIMVLGGTDKKGTWCGVRLYYHEGQTNEVQIRKAHKATNATAHLASNSAELGADFTGDRAAIRLQVKWDSEQGYKVYYDNAATVAGLSADATEVGSGSVGTGYVQPTVTTSTPGGSDSYRAPTEATILCAIGQSQDQTIGNASECRIVNFNVHSAS